MCLCSFYTLVDLCTLQAYHSSSGDGTFRYPPSFCEFHQRCWKNGFFSMMSNPPSPFLVLSCCSFCLLSSSPLPNRHLDIIKSKTNVRLGTTHLDLGAHNSTHTIKEHLTRTLQTQKYKYDKNIFWWWVLLLFYVILQTHLPLKICIKSWRYFFFWSLQI